MRIGPPDQNKEEQTYKYYFSDQNKYLTIYFSKIEYKIEYNLIKPNWNWTENFDYSLSLKDLETKFKSF